MAETSIPNLWNYYKAKTEKKQCGPARDGDAVPLLPSGFPPDSLGMGLNRAKRGERRGEMFGSLVQLILAGQSDIIYIIFHVSHIRPGLCLSDGAVFKSTDAFPWLRALRVLRQAFSRPAASEPGNL